MPGKGEILISTILENIFENGKDLETLNLYNKILAKKNVEISRSIQLYQINGRGPAALGELFRFKFFLIFGLWISEIGDERGI